MIQQTHREFFYFRKIAMELKKEFLGTHFYNHKDALSKIYQKTLKNLNLHHFCLLFITGISVDFSSDPNERRHRVVHDQAGPDAGHEPPPRHPLHSALRKCHLSVL